MALFEKQKRENENWLGIGANLLQLIHTLDTWSECLMDPTKKKLIVA